MALTAFYDAVPPGAKPVLDLIAVSTTITAVVGAVTSVIGLVGVIASALWALVRLYETKTMQRWLGRKPRTRHDD